MSLHELVTIRQLELADLNFILSSSVKCLSQYDSTLFKGWDKQTLCKHLEKIILFGLSKCGYSIFIACDAKDSNHIISYLVGNPQTNHIFLQYTKYTYRKLGIQKNLLLPLIIDPAKLCTVEWGTKEMIKLHKANKIDVKHEFVEKLAHALAHKASI